MSRIWEGTYAAMQATTDAPVGTEWTVTSGTNVGNKYEYRGATVGWAPVLVDVAVATKITVSGGYTYIGEAMPGSLQASAVWRCSRVDSSGNTLWADGNGNFDNVATDLTALIYS